MLADAGVQRLVDVRSFPSSRRWPHFNQEPLRQSLQAAGIEYVHLLELGGRRHTVLPDSPNVALRHPAFRSYADYMMTSEFSAGIDRLLELAADRQVAIMCAEAVYWRCHRRLISDYLTWRGVEVTHILGPRQLREHVLTQGAVLTPQGVRYSLLAA